ncbi:MAG: hypothetical protein PHV02_11500 [Rhodocyclaceae bacterium]|nr:hypothetical protein [Rhodocyclaceae bacterium]
MINRLEEFASAVHDRLDTIDFVMKREVILGLVKRVEIHKEEILVVFRVDPDPGLNAKENSANSDVGEKSMQDRTRRPLPIAGEHLLALCLRYLVAALAPSGARNRKAGNL